MSPTESDIFNRNSVAPTSKLHEQVFVFLFLVFGIFAMPAATAGAPVHMNKTQKTNKQQTFSDKLRSFPTLVVGFWFSHCLQARQGRRYAGPKTRNPKKQPAHTNYALSRPWHQKPSCIKKFLFFIFCL